MDNFAQEVIDAQSHEIGILSSQLIIEGLRLKKSMSEIAFINEQNEALRARIIAQDADIQALRLQVAPKNHPSKRVRKE